MDPMETVLLPKPANFEDDGDDLDIRRYFHNDNKYATLQANNKRVHLERDGRFQTKVSDALFQINKFSSVRGTAWDKLSGL